jgi:hypothetical protein
MNAWHDMLDDLLANRPEVILVPSRQRECAERGGMIRMAISRNPVWYRALCNKYPSSRGRERRKPDTRVRRRNILRLLQRLANGEHVRSAYLPDLLHIREEHFDARLPP